MDESYRRTMYHCPQRQIVQNNVPDPPLPSPSYCRSVEQCYSVTWLGELCAVQILADWSAAVTNVIIIMRPAIHLHIYTYIAYIYLALILRMFTAYLPTTLNYNRC